MKAPVVSCIMFADRSFAFFQQSLCYFLRQDLAEKELLIVADFEAGIEERTSQTDAIRFLHSQRPASRQEQWRGALESCRGRYIALWDCGDWIGTDRLSSQVRHLTEAGAAVCVARELAYYCPLAALAWISEEATPSYLCRKTFLCDRLFPGFEQQAAAFALERRGVRNEPPRPVTRMRAPWYVAISSEAVASSGTPVHPHRKPIPVGEIAKTIWPDREFYTGLRLRSRPKPRRFVRATTAKTRAACSGPLPKPLPIAAAQPRVSCLMATYDRRSFVPQAIQCFLDQDYRHRELIIVDDGPEPIEDLVPRDPRIHYLWSRSRRSIGAKRNLACELATGDYLMCWDDDDWFGPDRITCQVTPMLTERFDATVLLTGYMLDLADNCFWHQDPEGPGGLFCQGANWGTLAWSRKWWAKGLRYPDHSLAEDVALQESLVRHGAHIGRLPNEGAYVYVRHGKNTWQFPFGKIRAEGWRMIGPPPFLPESALRFYGFPAEKAFPDAPRSELVPGEPRTLT